MKEILKPALRLFLIAVIAAALLGGTYMLTKAPIEEQEKRAETLARQAVLQDAAEFVSVELSETAGEYDAIREVYAGLNGDGEPVGYAISVTAKGYNPGISLTVGLYPDGSISALNVGSNEESPGLGANASKPEFYEQFTGKSGTLGVTKGIPGENEIAAISGATMTSRGITEAVNTVLEYYRAYLAQ